MILVVVADVVVGCAWDVADGDGDGVAVAGDCGGVVVEVAGAGDVTEVGVDVAGVAADVSDVAAIAVDATGLSEPSQPAQASRIAATKRVGFSRCMGPL